ncbi:stage V sporulation protein AD [Tumebacillus permanentifrigoris]|uniref:Stage V sporulation protein AD n=1 Tax=Tumebacillus permanentifrigoris TaxID=378543 RepID=A0A316DAY5_9BACL|nr:stage V sporulation protein AD [Tumebacillus permanentifrigoris]PWK14469.1 stage V sporulation protein AD [Tumebacillus permanentifrigoris]
MPLIGKQTWQFDSKPVLQGTGVIVGPREGKGPLAMDFDEINEDAYFGQESWEKAERRFLEEAVQIAMRKANVTREQIDVMFAGDLLNQIITANFSARTLAVPFLGLFGACSTSMEGLALAALTVDSGFATHAIAATASHNSTAERQFRYPTEYGGQKPPSAQCTVTGGAAAIVSKSGLGPRITHATIGKVVDFGIKNPFEMGPAMAPAAADTIWRHFQDTGRTVDEYDLIVTGDLARVGHPLAAELLEEQGLYLGDKFKDCGILIFDPDQPEVFSGGSGCACCGVVTFGHLMRRMQQGEFGRILVCATGALLSPLSSQQGESIPCVAHAVVIERGSET